jgi:hypothetical protein
VTNACASATSGPSGRFIGRRRRSESLTGKVALDLDVRASRYERSPAPR